MKAKRPDEPVEIHWENLEYSLQANALQLRVHSTLRSASCRLPGVPWEYDRVLARGMALQSPLVQNRVLRFLFTSSINMMTITVSCVCIHYIAKLQVRRAAP